MRAFVLSVVVGLALVPAGVSADRLALYSDGGTDCNLSLTGDISWQFHIYHESVSGATGSDFRVSFDWGTGGGAVNAFSTVYADGPYTWYSGQQLLYGSCKTGSFWVATMIISGFTNQPCEAFAHTLDVSFRDCSDVWQEATGATLTIDGNESCPCTDPVATEASTWGRIKSLYH